MLTVVLNCGSSVIWLNPDDLRTICSGISEALMGPPRQGAFAGVVARALPMHPAAGMIQFEVIR
jgi:hypothetical protein